MLFSTFLLIMQLSKWEICLFGHFYEYFKVPFSEKLNPKNLNFESKGYLYVGEILSNFVICQIDS